MGACHLCHRCSWSSLRQCHWEGARGCQCRSRDAQESGKYDKAKLISSDILIGSQTKSKSSSSAFWQKVTNPFTGAFIVSVMRNPLLLPIPFSPSYGLFTHLSKPLFPADGLCSRLSLSLSVALSAALIDPFWRAEEDIGLTCAEGNGWIISCHFSLRKMNCLDPVGRRQLSQISALSQVSWSHLTGNGSVSGAL